MFFEEFRKIPSSSLACTGEPSDCADGYIPDYFAPFQVCFEPGVFEYEPQLRSRLTKDFAYFAEVLPSFALEVLSDLKYYLNKDYQYPDPADNTGSGAVFHPNPGWLKEHGNDPAKATHIEVYNVKKYLAWKSSQPLMLLHEAAHAFDFRSPEWKRQLIKDVFNEVIPTGIYDSVPYYDGRYLPAYARVNHAEYFAEISEAFFSGYDVFGNFYRNDYYAFELRELKNFDPAGFQLCQILWEVEK